MSFIRAVRDLFTSCFGVKGRANRVAPVNKILVQPADNPVINRNIMRLQNYETYVPTAFPVLPIQRRSDKFHPRQTESTPTLSPRPGLGETTPRLLRSMHSKLSN